MHHERAVACGIVADAGAAHPTKRDENGDPLIDIRKVEAYLQERATQFVQEAAERVGLWTVEANKANGLLRAEVDAVGQVLENAKSMKKDFIDTLRGMRMTSTTEVAAMMKPLEDVRRFFLGDQHKEEVERLKEFIELCERLQKLKESGFLDSVADTMLKLA